MLLIIFVPLGAYSQITTHEPIKSGSSNVRDFIVNKNNESVFFTEGNKVLQYSYVNKSIVNTPLIAHRDDILTLEQSWDQKFMISAGRDSSIVIWNIASRSIYKKLSHHSAIVLSIAMSKDNRYVISSGTDKRVIVLDII